MLKATNFLQVLDSIWELADYQNYALGTPNGEVDVEKGKITLSWDLPGASKETIEIENEGQTLIVKGGVGRYKGLTTKVRIGKDYDLTTTDATMKDGVLIVTISKGSNVPRNKITIK